MNRIVSIVAGLFILVLASMPAAAQNCTTFTAPAGDATNKCASTAFVHTNAGLFDGKPWCDPRSQSAVAIDNGSTDALAAINACITILSTPSAAGAAGGTLYFSSGFYCVSGTINISAASLTPIRVIGEAGINATSIFPCAGADINVLNLNNTWSTLENINIYGKGILDSTFGATQPALTLGSNCVSCKVDHVYVLGGSPTFLNLAADSRISDSLFTLSYGLSIVYVHGTNTAINAGSRWIGTSFDQSCPVSIPAPNTIVNARANTTGYTTGTMVSIVQGGVTYYIQASNNGTSGGSAPALKNYGQPIVDGTVTWFLVRPLNYFAMQIDSWAQEVFVGGTAADFSGCYSAGLALTNILGGTAPTLNHFDGLVIGSQEGAAIYATDGSAFYLSNSEVFAGWGRPGSSPQEPDGILFVSNFAGPSLITKNQIAGSVAGSAGMNILSGTNHVIVGNAFSSNSTGINVAANLTDFVINSNSFQDTASVTINAGTGSRYSVSGNNVHGVAPTDLGTGTKKNVAFNDGYGVPIVNNNVGELPTLVSGTVFAAGSADALATTVFLNSWGNATVFQGQRAGGTNAAKTALAAGDVIIRMGAGGWDGSAYTAIKGAVDIRGAGTWSGTSDPTRIVFATTAISSTTRTDRWTVQDDGGMFSTNASGGSKGIDTLNTITLFGTNLNIGSQGAISNTTALISGNATAVSGSQAGVTTFLQVVGANSASPGVFVDSFASAPIFGFRRANTTAASRSVAVANDQLGIFGGYGWDGSAYGTSGFIEMIAGETFSGTAHGGSVDVFTTPLTTTTLTGMARFSASGGLSVGSAGYTTDPGNGGLLGTGTIKTTSTTDATSTTTGALQINGGTSINKRVFMNGLSADTASTDNTLCHDTTSHEIKTGTGALGVCLGTSSARYKRDIIDVRAGLDDLLRLRPVNFYYLPGRGGPQIQYGFIAEEVVNVIPSLVGLDRNAEPNTVDMFAMVPIIVKAIQELKSEVDDLSARATRHPSPRARASLGTARP